MIRLAEARLSASTISRCSISHLLIGSKWLCITKASEPRTDSWKRTYISPLAKSWALVGVTSMSRCFAISCASSGNARPENSMRVLRFSMFLPLTASLLVVGAVLGRARWARAAASAAGEPARRRATHPSMVR